MKDGKNYQYTREELQKVESTIDKIPKSKLEWWIGGIG
jgi:hypothetical protein